VVNQLVFALFLERNDNERDEDVDEEKREDDEVDDVEDGHLHAVPGLWTVVLDRRIHRVRQHAACTKNCPLKMRIFGISQTADAIYSESKNPPLRTCGNVSKTVGNFSTKFYVPITGSYLR